MAEPVVVDTMIARAWLGVRRSQRQIRWAPILQSAVWVLPFVVVAEMRFGAEVAGWGARRRGVLERLVARAGVVPPLDEVTDVYVDLRAWCVRTGHGLGAKDHEADRWVAAVAGGRWVSVGDRGRDLRRRGHAATEVSRRLSGSCRRGDVCCASDSFVCGRLFSCVSPKRRCQRFVNATRSADRRRAPTSADTAVVDTETEQD